MDIFNNVGPFDDIYLLASIDIPANKSMCVSQNPQSAKC